MQEARKRHHYAMTILDEVDKGFFGLRALLHLCFKMPEDRYKVLLPIMQRFKSEINASRDGTFKKLKYAENGSKCPEQSMREHRIRCQHQIIFDTIDQASRLLHADEVVETTVRGAA